MLANALLCEHQTSSALQKYVKNAPESRQRSHVGLDEEPKCTKNSWHCCLLPACLGNRALGSLVGFYNRRNQHHPRFHATIMLLTTGYTTSEHHYIVSAYRDLLFLLLLLFLLFLLCLLSLLRRCSRRRCGARTLAANGFLRQRTAWQ